MRDLFKPLFLTLLNISVVVVSILLIDSWWQRYLMIGLCFGLIWIVSGVKLSSKNINWSALKSFYNGLLLALVIVFLIRLIWTVLGFGVFVGLVKTDFLGQFVFLGILTGYLIAVYGFEKFSRANWRETLPVAGLVALVTTLFGVLSVTEYVSQVVLWVLVFGLGRRTNWVLAWGLIMGYYYFSWLIDYALVLDADLVLGAPGARIWEALILIVVNWLLIKNFNKITKK